MDFKPEKVETRENELFYRLDGEAAERHGFVGYLRGDYGRDGKEFWTTWFNGQRRLKSSSFKREFNSLIGWLKAQSGRSDIIDTSFENHCLQNLRHHVTDTAVRFKVQTENFTYYARFQPRMGADNDFYITAFDNRWLLPELAGKHELPVDCYSVLPSTGELILIVRERYRYSRSSNSTLFPDINRKIADESNAHCGVTRQQEEAMLAGSLFGWDTPAAKPWNYDENGKLRLPSKNKNEPERG
ncbi:MAG: hypothetical protein LBQ48_06435 [Oscillospiraceae bacterium]|jgi:hypothetical protein|nr:hypothetical protein [Oscillospiraceae bacterium]